VITELIGSEASQTLLKTTYHVVVGVHEYFDLTEQVQICTQAMVKYYTAHKLVSRCEVCENETGQPYSFDFSVKVYL